MICTVGLQVQPSPLQVALFNARSFNKTFILNDRISSLDLDMFLITETWLKRGSNTPLSELLLADYLFFKSPCLSGRGGGLASVFKPILKYCCLPSKSFSSFELQTFVLTLHCPILCAVIYRPPKSKEFLQEFGGFLAAFIPQADCMLICGDFNIHVNSLSDQHSNDFNALLDSFDLNQFICPTHKQGGTLNLVISRGLSVCIKDVSNIYHFFIHFEVLLSTRRPRPVAPLQYRRIITPSTPADFAAAFSASEFQSTGDQDPTVCPEAFLASLNSTCARIMDSVAPFRTRRAGNITVPWQTDTTRALRRSCRRAERKWKKDGLLTLLHILRSSLRAYQEAAKKAKTQYLAKNIANNSRNPRILFKMIHCHKPSRGLAHGRLRCSLQSVSELLQ